jgi:site-specific DNA recombinase
MKAALCARYSTEMQREQSIEDQYRVAARIAERHGFTVVAKFADQAISGGTTQRPQYQRMLTAARRHEFDVMVAEDTSRLWRNLAEQSPRVDVAFTWKTYRRGCGLPSRDGSSL